MSDDRIPAPRASRPAVGVRARTAAAPLSADEIDGARLVVLVEADAESLDAAVAALPDPATLAPGTLVVVPAQVEQPRSLARSVLAVLGRAKTVTRTRRCTALVARGYVEVGAAASDDGDLAWGRAPRY